ncbi:hypothetical protein Cni_G17079 [Canna indica]|uniref:Uncharacterized protein n=1 Tax=Canna indica TaxID=4628 RepID=A0AAQ3QG88_9LILI|nr:hypothetical protein Cni_G17079 [Canna indica]
MVKLFRPPHPLSRPCTLPLGLPFPPLVLIHLRGSHQPQLPSWQIASSLVRRRHGLLSLVLLVAVADCVTSASSIHVDFIRRPSYPPFFLSPFREVPPFRNADDCPFATRIDVAMTLDTNYLRGTMAAVLSILQHTSGSTPGVLASICVAFPYLDFRVYHFDSGRVRDRISRYIFHVLDQPLN